jgi:ribosomal-protein-alanine N-acetyltransferase
MRVDHQSPSISGTSSINRSSRKTKSWFAAIVERIRRIISTWWLAIRKMPLLIRQTITGYKPMNLPKTLTLETERFTLSPLKKEDEDAVFVTMNCPTTAHIISFLKWPMTLDQASALCSKSVTGFAWKRGFICLARNKEDSSPVGCIGLGLADNDCKAAEVGYWVTENWQQRGCATEMLKAVIDFAFKPPCNLSRLTGVVAYENHISKRVLEKQGFQIVGSKVLRTAKGTNLSCHVYELKNKITPR